MNSSMMHNLKNPALTRAALAAWVCSALSLVPLAANAENPPSVHAGISCRQCHLGPAGAGAALDSSNCLTCHEIQATGPAAAATADTNASARYAATSFHGENGRNCLRCHSFHEPELGQSAAGPVDVGAARQLAAGHCTTCHAPGTSRDHLNGAHLQAAALYHARGADLIGTSASAGCLSCHDRDSESAWLSATAEAPLTLNTHASHPIGTRVVPGGGPAGNRMRHTLDPRIPLFDGRLECQTCHVITAQTKDLLLGWGSPKEMCLGCHQLGSDKQVAANRLRDLRPVVMGTLVK